MFFFSLLTGTNTMQLVEACTGYGAKNLLNILYSYAVFRIRDPVLFYPRDPGSRMEQWSDPDPG
jgi:hypothetical protein